MRISAEGAAGVDGTSERDGERGDDWAPPAAAVDEAAAVAPGAGRWMEHDPTRATEKETARVPAMIDEREPGSLG